MKQKISLMIVLSAILLQGCKVHFDAINARVPVMMNAKAVPPYTIVTHFAIHQDVKVLFLQRLIGEGKPDINSLLEQQLQMTPGDAMINVRIHGDTEVGDFLLPIVVGIGGGLIFPPFAFFIYEPFFFDLKTYSVEGDIIKYFDRPIIQLTPAMKIDPMTGLPMEEKKKIEFDPETGLPKK